MKGKISLGDFIEQVKKELVEAQKISTEPFYSLKEVELEASFVLDTKAKASGKLFVVELGSEFNMAQTHKVKLKLKPLKRLIEGQATQTDGSDVGTASGGGGVGGGGINSLKEKLVVYAPTDKIKVE